MIDDARIFGRVKPYTRGSTNGFLRWKISKRDFGSGTDLYSPEITFSDGLAKYKFQLVLMPGPTRGEQNGLASLKCVLKHTPSQLCDINFCSLEVSLINGNPSGSNYSVTVCPFQLKEGEPEMIIPFFPHSALNPGEGFLNEDKIVIDATAMSASKEDLREAKRCLRVVKCES